MTENERKEAINCIKTQLENGYIDVDGEHYKNEIEVIKESIDKQVAIDAGPCGSPGIVICPICKASVIHKNSPICEAYCFNCGQKLIWEEW